MNFGKLTVSALTAFAVSFLISCDRKKTRTNEPSKEVRVLMSHHEKVDTLIGQLDAELSSAQMNEAFDLYVKNKPRVVVTHDAPASLFETGGPMELNSFYPSSTAVFL
jgi:hypothetical protein